MLAGGESITETHISTITDTIILLRYVELHGQMRRGLTVLKMRGTAHDKNIREYTIDNTGMHVLAPFRGVHGILSGTPTYTFDEERPRLGGMFGSAGLKPSDLTPPTEIAVHGCTAPTPPRKPRHAPDGCGATPCPARRRQRRRRRADLRDAWPEAPGAGLRGAARQQLAESLLLLSARPVDASSWI
jgi:hypothetical protein